MGHRAKKGPVGVGGLGLRTDQRSFMTFHVLPISEQMAEKVRKTMLSPQYPGLPAFSSVASGYGPCRSCLRTFDEGNDYRTSFTYDPVEGILDLPQPGPVFIHSANCERFVGNEFPEGLRGIPMYFEAFDNIGELLHRVRAETGTEGSQIDSLFADKNVDFLHIRNAEAGCFIARVEKG